MSLKNIQMLARYNAWANDLMFKAISELPHQEIIKERHGIYKSIVYTLNHTYVINQVWQAHLENREHGFTARNTKDCPIFEELWRAQKIIDAWYISYSDSLFHDALNETIHFTLIGGSKSEMTREEILMHVVNHTTYHRGVVADMLYQIPAKPPTTDLPVFLKKEEQHDVV